MTSPPDLPPEAGPTPRLAVQRGLAIALGAGLAAAVFALPPSRAALRPAAERVEVTPPACLRAITEAREALLDAARALAASNIYTPLIARAYAAGAYGTGVEAIVAEMERGTAELRAAEEEAAGTAFPAAASACEAAAPR